MLDCFFIYTMQTKNNTIQLEIRLKNINTKLTAMQNFFFFYFFTQESSEHQLKRFQKSPFSPFTLRRYTSVFKNLHPGERFRKLLFLGQTPVFLIVFTISMDGKRKRIKKYSFLIENVLMWMGPQFLCFVFTISILFVFQQRGTFLQDDDLAEIAQFLIKVKPMEYTELAAQLNCSDSDV